MKLLLASSTDTLIFLDKQLKEGAENRRVLFCSNASDSYNGDKWWVTADRKALEKIGCEITDIDFWKIEKEELIKLLDSSALLHISGGCVLHLMLALKNKGFDKIISEYIRKDKILYSGTSAGSMVASTSITLSQYDDDEQPWVKESKDFNGLGLVPFYILPHTNSEDSMATNPNITDKFQNNPQPIILLRDNQAIWVENDSFKMIQI